MDEFARGPTVQEVRPGRDARRPHLSLVVGGRRFAVLASDPDSCLIEAPERGALRGLADLYEGERHVAQCLIVLAAPEGNLVRCAFKRRTPARAEPPRDFA